MSIEKKFTYDAKKERRASEEFNHTLHQPTANPDHFDEHQETEEELMRSQIGNMIFHGWWVWPSKIPHQPGYEYAEWIDYDMKWKTWSRPMCSIWLRLKWLFRRTVPSK